jgi:Zn-dependent M28 family amino/carboxypeptidase
MSRACFRPFVALAAACVLAPVSLGAQQRDASIARVTAAIRASEIWGPLRFLSDDLLEGRGTGARGGELTVQYLASRFMALGLEPAGDSGTYFQRVPIVAQNPTGTLEYTAGGESRPLRYRQDFVAWSEQVPAAPAPSERPGAPLLGNVDAVGELVFVGFGIAAPEWQWDDFKGVDLRDKILLVLVNDPGLRDSTIFRGKTLTYYGRWTYKLEEAARRGARGVLLVHNDTMATYGWNTVVNSWTGDQVRLLKPNTSLLWAGWITQSAASAMLRDRNLDLALLMGAAARRDFRPVSTGITVHGAVTSVVRRTTTANVVARLPGSDPALRNEAVAIGAHWDHHGIGRPVNGDSILNGALDNASGVAAMLAVADAYVRTGVRPRRSLLFVAFTAEEKGLLGSQAFAENPPIPLRNIAAILNIDGVGLWGETRDIGALGADQSSLGRTFERAARANGLRVSVNREALASGGFFRSDHFPLAKVGVPGLSFQGGDDFVGRPANWGREQRDEYNRLRYHQPGDEILPWYTVDGALQQARVLARAAWLVGEDPRQPIWGPASEFRAAGERRLGP